MLPSSAVVSLHYFTLLSLRKMGRTQMCLCCHKYRQTIMCLILFASTFLFTHILFMAEGRAISNLNEVAQKGMMEERGSKAQIGSRPPKCERRCRTCGDCEAVQVPIVPQVQTHRRSHYSATVITYSTRGDDLSNYKPISWKCKCGDHFFNP